MSATVLPEKGFVRLEQILGSRRKQIPAIIPISKSAWYEGIEKGRFPKPVKLGPRASGWRAEDIQRLINELSEAA